MAEPLSAAQKALRRAKAQLHASGSGTAPHLEQSELSTQSASTLSPSPSSTPSQPTAHSRQAPTSFSAHCSLTGPIRHDVDGTVSERCGSAQSTGSTYGATASRGPSGSADGITQSSAPAPATTRLLSAPPLSTRASPSSDTPEAHPAFSASSALAGGQVEVELPSWRVPSPACSTSPVPQSVSSSPPASLPTRQSTPDPAVTPPLSDSPDAHPPTPAPSPASHAPTDGRQTRQRTSAAHAHVRFSVPLTDAEAGRVPSSAPPAAPPPSVSAADQAAMALLRRLSFAEVQLTQLYVARGAAAAAAVMVPDAALESAWGRPGVDGSFELSFGENTDEEEAGEAWWGEVPATLDVTAALRSSRRLRAALADDSDAAVLDESDEQPSSVRAVVERDASAAGAVGAGSRGPNRGPNGATEHAQGPSAAAPSHMADTRDPANAWADAKLGAPADGEDADDALTLSPITRASPTTPPPGPSILVSPSPACRTPGQMQAAWPASPSIGKSRIATAAAAQKWTLADFDVGRRIGQGRSGRVFMVREKQSKVVVALKVMAEDAARVRDGRSAPVERALRLQAAAARQCPYVVRLYTSFSDEWRRYAVLEYAADGDLAAHLAAQPQRRLSEAQARPLVRHIACALAQLHRHGIVHRAVTARNVLLRRAEGCGADSAGDLLAKLGDFTWAVQLPDGDGARWAGRLDESAGGAGGGRLLDYAAPEVICGRGWSYKSDVWALGVLAFEMLCGYAPFDDVSPAGVKRLVCAGKACFPPHGLSHTATSFLRALLRVEEPARCDAAAALAHPFLAADAVSAAHGKAPWEGAPPPVSRDLSQTFSQAAASGCTGNRSRRGSGSGAGAALARSDTGHSAVSGTRTGAATSPSPDADVSDGASFSPAAGTVHAGESASVNTSLTASSSPSPTSLSSSSAAAHVRRRVSTASLVSAAPPSSFISTASPLMAFAFPTSPLEESAGGTAVPATPLSAAVVAAAMSTEEPEPYLGHRASGSSLRSTGHVSRPTITPTLSDMSASLLSATHAPNALSSFGPLAVVPDERASRQANRSNAASAGALQGCARRRSGSDAGEVCSITVSSLSSASPPAARGECGAGDAAVSVSSSTSAASTHASREATDGHADRRVAVPHRCESAPSTAGPSAPRAAGVVLAAARDTKRKRPTKTPPCAVRLRFDALSDEEDGW